MSKQVAVEAIKSVLPAAACEIAGDSLPTRLLEAVEPVLYKHFSDRLLSDEVIEAVARKRVYPALLPVGMDFESYEDHLAKHGQEDEGFRAETRRDLEAALQATAIPTTSDEEGR